MRATEIQISLQFRAVWPEPSFSAWRNCASVVIQNVPSGDSDQTANGRLIWIFAGRICPKVRFLTLWLIIKLTFPNLSVFWLFQVYFRYRSLGRISYHCNQLKVLMVKKSITEVENHQRETTAKFVIISEPLIPPFHYIMWWRKAFPPQF